MSVVHRDLKPANVVVTSSGSVKVLDFGIAKLRAADEPTAVEPTTTGALTDARAIVGTLGYVSPEQAHGRVVDGRSDIFSLGVVLHEMITGHRPFQGESAAALLSSVLSHDPPLLRTVAASTPRSVERCVARCLQKDPGRRYQNAADLLVALEDIREDLAAPAAVTAPPEAVALPLRGSRALRPLTYTISATAIGAAAFLVGRSLSALTTMPTPDYRPFITEAQSVGVPVWSPDGRTLAYIAEDGGRRQVFLRGLDATESTQLTRQGADGISLFWSPDGARI